MTPTFVSLSVPDLLEARNQYHLHLMNKANVVATAIGRFRYRLSDLDKHGRPLPKEKRPKKDRERRLSNSTVVDESWPCVLVFVKEWQHDLAKLIEESERPSIIPPYLYLSDGRIVPTCIVLADKDPRSSVTVSPDLLRYPRNPLSGGCPIVALEQGETRVASVGCLVSDGNDTYILTNAHVAGKRGRPIYGVLGGQLQKVGEGTGKALRKLDFGKAYPSWTCPNHLLNMDVGLVRVEDVTQWKAEVLHLGQLNEVADYNDTNFPLELIGREVQAYGAVSGLMTGEIAALFYRHKSVGGFEYITDFLIGPGQQPRAFQPHHGDSGTLWLTREGAGEWQPFALQWGQQNLTDGESEYPFVLATSLGTACRLLDVDLVRGWNLDQDYTWGKVGHFAIGSKLLAALDGRKEYRNLRLFLQANEERITFKAPEVTRKLEEVTGLGDFVRLADVADLVWKGKQPGITRSPYENPCHYADLDLPCGKETLMDLPLDQGKWDQFYTKAHTAKNKRGCLPFRVGQLYDAMVRAVTGHHREEFLTIVGVLTHYVGDAAMPLHGSRHSRGDDTPETRGLRGGDD